MATFWRRRMIRRRLRSLLRAGEELTTFERLELGGWWALSDQALYTLGRFDEPKRLALTDIRSVQVHARQTSALLTVTSASGSVIAGDLHAEGELVRILRNLPSSS